MSHNEPLNRSKLLKLAFAIMQNDLDETMDQKDLIKLAFLKLAGPKKKEERRAKQKANTRARAYDRAQRNRTIGVRTGVASIIPNSYEGPGKVGGLPEIKALFGVGNEQPKLLPAPTAESSSAVETQPAKKGRNHGRVLYRTNSGKARILRGSDPRVPLETLKKDPSIITSFRGKVKKAPASTSTALAVIPGSNVVSTVAPKSAPKGPGFWERFGKRVSETGQKGWNATKQFGKGIGAKGVSAGKFLGRNKGKAALIAAVLAALHENQGKRTARRELGASNAKIDRLMNRGFFDRLFNKDV